MPFDGLNRDLSGSPAYRVAEQLGKPVWVVDKSAEPRTLLRATLEPVDGNLESSGVRRALEQAMEAHGCTNQDSIEVDRALDRVARYPLEISGELLDRDQYRARLLEEARLRADARGLIERRFEILDESHALCVETWATANGLGTRRKWTHLLQRGGHWLLERVMLGSP
jgi:hypothetical protein